MSSLDTLLDAITQSDQINAQQKGIVLDFLNANRDLLEHLDTQSTRMFFETLYLHGAPGAWQSLISTLGQDELRVLLRQSVGEMDALVARRAQAMAQFHQFTESLGIAAVRLITSLLCAAL